MCDLTRKTYIYVGIMLKNKDKSTKLVDRSSRD